MTPREEAWLALLRVERLGSRTVQRLLDVFPDVEAVLAAPPAEIIARCGLAPELAARIAQAREAPAFQDERRRLGELGAALLPLDRADSPARLRALSAPPPLLYRRGTLSADDAPWLAVVGTRTPSRYGERMTRTLLEGIAAQDPRTVIVSGLARGIDTVAHTLALSVGLPTVAVLGTGLGTLYPRENQALAEAIAAAPGSAVLSEFPLDTGPIGRNFPIRNRIISGLADAVLVIEAGASSGALITAGFAQNHGRPVLALPGNVGEPTSDGTNRLLQEGRARMVLQAGDIATALRAPKRPAPTQLDWLGPTLEFVEDAAEETQGPAARESRPAAGPTGPHPGLTGDKGRILACLQRGALHPDDLAGETALPIDRLVGLLLELELSGEIYQTAENHYALA